MKRQKYLPNSLRYNTTFADLMLGKNESEGKGYSVYLKLLSDVPSIHRIFKSNHTLQALGLPKYINEKMKQMKQMNGHIDSAIKINLMQQTGQRSLRLN